MFYGADAFPHGPQGNHGLFKYPAQHMYDSTPKNHPVFLHVTSCQSIPSIFGPQEFRVKAAVSLPNVLTMEGLPMTRGPSLAGSALRPAGPAGPAPSLAPCTAMAGPAPPRAVIMAAGAFAAVAGKAVGSGRPAKWEVGITME